MLTIFLLISIEAAHVEWHKQKRRELQHVCNEEVFIIIQLFTITTGTKLNYPIRHVFSTTAKYNEIPFSTEKQ